MIGWALSLSPICQLMWCWTRILKIWQNRALLWTSYPFAELRHAPLWHGGGLPDGEALWEWRRQELRQCGLGWTVTLRRLGGRRRPGGGDQHQRARLQGLELPARLVPVLRRALLLVTCSSLLLCKYACLLAHTLTRSLAHPLPLSDLLVYRQHSFLLVGVHCLF